MLLNTDPTIKINKYNYPKNLNKHCSHSSKIQRVKVKGFLWNHYKYLGTIKSDGIFFLSSELLDIDREH